MSPGGTGLEPLVAEGHWALVIIKTLSNVYVVAFCIFKPKRAHVNCNI